jgi:hypothetical protein
VAAVSSLENQYGGEVDFVHVDWDDPDSQQVIDAFGAPRRSTYILLNPDGSVEWTFVGRLEEADVAAVFEEALSQ